jgi:hypothetical protein
LFLRGETPASVAARLQCREEAVCFRYMTDEVTRREKIAQLDRLRAQETKK